LRCEQQAAGMRGQLFETGGGSPHESNSAAKAILNETPIAIQISLLHFVRTILTQANGGHDSR